MSKYDYKLKNRVERMAKNQGNRSYHILDGGCRMVLFCYRDAKDVRNDFPNCKILRSHKMTEQEMLSYAKIVYSRIGRRLQYEQQGK